MPAGLEHVREIALALPDVTERLCHGTPAFYRGKKLMLRLRDEDGLLVVKYPLADREELIARHPDVFSVTDHYRAYPAVLMDLSVVDRGRLREMIEGAWTFLVPKRKKDEGRRKK